MVRHLGKKSSLVVLSLFCLPAVQQEMNSEYPDECIYAIYGNGNMYRNYRSEACFHT